MIHFTYCGLTCLFLMLSLLVKNKCNIIRLLIMPLFWILLSYFFFFGTYETIEFPVQYDLLLLLSFSIFILSYSFARKRRFKQIDNFFYRLVNRKGVSGENVVKDKFIFVFFIFVLFYCITNLCVNSIIYGSFEAALIRFYSSPVDDRLYVLMKRAFHFILLSFWPFVFVIRYFCNIYGKKSRLFIISVWLLVLVSIPAGSRMVAIMPIVLLLMADIIASAVHKVPLMNRLLNYTLMCSFSFFIFLFLTSVRLVKFEDVSDLAIQVESLSYENSSDTYADEKDLMVRDTKLCFDTFGKKVDFLPLFYTFNLFVYAPIPRALMPDKPVSFGLIINAVKNGQLDFDLDRIVYPGNIDWAAGIAGEGWANGGIVGLVFYSILLGIFSGVFSRLYYKMIVLNNYVAILFALLFFILSFCFVRGSIFTGTIGYLIVLFLFVVFVKCFYRKC